MRMGVGEVLVEGQHDIGDDDDDDILRSAMADNSDLNTVHSVWWVCVCATTELTETVVSH